MEVVDPAKRHMYENTLIRMIHRGINKIPFVQLDKFDIVYEKFMEAITRIK